MPNYDIIGDIHGQATKLTNLLEKLGYQKERTAFRHPNRTAIFLGDFIDRGPAIRDTLHLVHEMVTTGSALAVIGNHEFNALAFHHSHRSLLSHKFETQLSRTHDEFAGRQSEWEQYLSWFAELPFFLELGGLRIVHAVWSTSALEEIDYHRTLDPDFLAKIASSEAKHRAVDALLNGWKVQLPGDAFFEDFEGSARNTVRLAWWKNHPPFTYRNCCIPTSESLPDEELPRHLQNQIPGYPENASPVFFGHYCLPLDQTPWPLAPNVACVDYCAARKGPLVAYRWDGESRLDSSKFVC